MRRHFPILALTGLLALAGCKPLAGDKDDEGLVGERFMDSVHAQCIKKGGEYLPADKGGFVCMSVPSDAGKSCDSARDCESACLARSQTCAPVLPLLGCNEILTDSGAAVTQCID